MRFVPPRLVPSRLILTRLVPPCLLLQVALLSVPLSGSAQDPIDVDDLVLQPTYSIQFFAEDHWDEWFQNPYTDSTRMWLSAELLEVGIAAGTTDSAEDFTLEIYSIPHDFSDHRFPDAGAYQKLVYADATLTTASGSHEVTLRVQNYYMNGSWIGTQVRSITTGSSELTRHGYDLGTEPELLNGDPNPYFFEGLDEGTPFNLSSPPSISDGALFATLATFWPPLQCQGAFDPDCVQRALAKAREALDGVLHFLSLELKMADDNYAEDIDGWTEQLDNWRDSGVWDMTVGELAEQEIKRAKKRRDAAKKAAWDAANPKVTLILSQLHRDLQACCE